MAFPVGSTYIGFLYPMQNITQADIASAAVFFIDECAASVDINMPPGYVPDCQISVSESAPGIR